MKNKSLKLFLTSIVAMLSLLMGMFTLFVANPVYAEDVETGVEMVYNQQTQSYSTLQEALDVAVTNPGTYEIKFKSNLSEDVTIHQKADVNYVIDGDNKQYSGTMCIYGYARYTGAETLTIKNVNFVTNEAGHYFIDSNSTGSVERYAHNVTVENCSFSATGNGVNSAVAMRIRQGYNINVVNSNSDGLHSVLQGYGISGVGVEELTITSGKNAISLGTSLNVNIKDVEIDVSGYGIRADGSVVSELKLENCDISAELPVVVRKVTADYKVIVEEGNTFTASNEEGSQITFTTGDDGTFVAPTTGTVVNNSTDSSIVISGMLAKVDGNGYTDFAQALAALKENSVLTLLDDVNISNTISVAKNTTLKIDLNGHNITGTPAQAGVYQVISNKGNLIIEGSGTIKCDYPFTGSTSFAVNTITNSGTLVIDGATIENTTLSGSSQIGYAIDNNSTSGNVSLEIISGEVIASGSYYYDGIRIFANSTTNENTVLVQGGKISSIWLQNPSDNNGTGERNTKDVLGSVLIEGGELGSLYLEPSAIFTASVSGGYIGEIDYFDTTTEQGLENFISGGTFGSAMPEEFWAPGYIVTEQNGSYVAMDMVTYSEVALDILREVALQLASEKVYSNAGIIALEAIAVEYSSKMAVQLYPNDVKQVYQSAFEKFGYVLTQIQAEELLSDYLLDVKEYCELKNVDINDQRIEAEFSKLELCGLKSDMNLALAGVYNVIDAIAEENAVESAPEYSDQKLVTLLYVVIGVQALIVIFAIIILAKIGKAKKQGGKGPDNNLPTKDVVATAVEAQPVVNNAVVEDQEDDEEGSPFANLSATSKTFEEKLELADDVVKQAYNTISNQLLNYKKVNARVSKKAVSFRTGRKLIAKLSIVGKTLRVYLALDPNAYETSKFFQKDASDKKAYEEVPMLMRVRSGRAINRTVKLIADVAEKFDLVAKN